jgi:hypothetical protein
MHMHAAPPFYKLGRIKGKKVGGVIGGVAWQRGPMA